MNCEQVRQVLEAFMNGTLNGEEARSVRLHLASCAGCISKLKPSELIEVLPVVDEVIEPSEDFALRFHARLQEHRRQASDKRLKSWRIGMSAWARPWQLVAAGAMVTLLIAGLFIGRYRGGIPDQYFSSDIAVAENLPLLKDMAVINNLDLLEDFDTIENLNLTTEGSNTLRSNP